MLNKAREVVFQGNSLAQYRNRWVFLNLYENDFQGPDDPPPTSHPPQQLHKEIDLSINLSIPDPIRYHPLHSFSITESYLLDYFIRGISPGCSLSDLHNPYVSLVVPLCFVSVTLRHTLLAVAASRLCSPGNGKYMKQACHHKHIALTGLRHEISTGQYDDGTIASILMLCFHDVFLPRCTISRFLNVLTWNRYRMGAPLHGWCIYVAAYSLLKEMCTAPHQSSGSFSGCIL